MATKLWTFVTGARDEFVVVAMALLILGGQTQAALFCRILIWRRSSPVRRSTIPIFR